MVHEVDVLVRRAIEVRGRLEEIEATHSRLHEEYEDHRRRLRRMGQDLMATSGRRPNGTGGSPRRAEQCARVLHRDAT